MSIETRLAVRTVGHADRFYQFNAPSGVKEAAQMAIVAAKEGAYD